MRERSLSRTNSVECSLRSRQQRQQSAVWVLQTSMNSNRIRCLLMLCQMSSKECSDLWDKTIHLGMQWRNSLVRLELFRVFWTSTQGMFQRTSETRSTRSLKRSQCLSSNLLSRVSLELARLLPLGSRPILNTLKPSWKLSLLQMSWMDSFRNCKSLNSGWVSARDSLMSLMAQFKPSMKISPTKLRKLNRLSLILRKLKTLFMLHKVFSANFRGRMKDGRNKLFN